MLNDPRYAALGPLLPLLEDPEISEIMVNGYDEIRVEHRGRRRRHTPAFESPQRLRYTIERLVDIGGARVDEMNPFADLALPDGSRVNIAIPPVVPVPYVTIRKLVSSLKSLDDLERLGSLDRAMVGFLRASVTGQRNLLFSGATGAGKTTVMSLMGRAISESERIILIEDTPELRFEQPDVVSMRTRVANVEGRGRISSGDLFRNCLRMRPDRIILGELRGPEAVDYLQAINSGHDGSMAVIHASSPEQALLRLENLCSLSEFPVPARTVRRQISHGLHLIIQCDQLADGRRVISRVTEVLGMEEGEVRLRDRFRYDLATDSFIESTP